MGDTKQKEPTPHALDDLVRRAGKNNPKLLDAILDGTSNEELIAEGASIATARIVVDATRLYGEALDFFERATATQKNMVRGASPELLSVAVHHLDALRTMEGTLKQRAQGNSAGRAVVDQDLQDAVTAAINVRDQAYRALCDAGQTKRYVVQVDEAYGVVKPPEKLAAGLSAMGLLLLEWLDSDDSALHTRLRLARLDKAYVTELDVAATTLRKALAAAAKRSSVKGHQAELDREDGVQILLLGQIIRAFEAAHGRDATIPRLVPISTRRLFSRAASRSSGGESSTPVTPTKPAAAPKEEAAPPKNG